VLVVADAGRLHLGEDFAYEARDLGRVAEDALALAAATADGLQAEPTAGLLAQQAIGFEPEGLGELVDREEIDPLLVRRLEHLLRVFRGGRLVVGGPHLELVLFRERGERRAIR